ncbi:zinc-ribbon domain-containing protein [Herbiconiux sp. VKM Ac-2851]|uniref:zinc-ribbon domain-containing protein n=1 Tax=Herbiconiux sp. VKM Ac-2851 TaxID=2739025 RepID=UPI001564DF10|nr:hypothetical protein [Herbiconiux sp. VKM Ac-2851]
MPESIDAWWSRRQRSKGSDVPYAVGTYRDDWAPYPVLVRQYHPDLNRMITLTQVPPAADVYLTWQCESGHVFIATPAEQRSRPGGGQRRRSVWCPTCSDLAAPRRPPKPFPGPAVPLDGPAAAVTPTPDPLAGVESRPLSRATRPGSRVTATGGTRSSRRDGRASGPTAYRGAARSERAADPLPPAGPGVGAAARRARAGIVRLAVAPFVVPPLPESPAESVGPAHPPPPAMPGAEVRSEDVRTDPRHRAGDAFHSTRAPRTASAAEAELRSRLAERFDLDLSPERANAVAVTRPFFGRTEVWPDIVIPELRVAIEYDTVGRFGLEHVGPREDTDRRKDRMLRAVDWEVVRVRCGKLQTLGPHDIVASGVTARLIDSLIDTLRTIRGDLFVNAYLR